MEHDKISSRMKYLVSYCPYKVLVASFSTFTILFVYFSQIEDDWTLYETLSLVHNTHKKDVWSYTIFYYYH